MHINVSHILREGEGARADFTVEQESPSLEGITLASPINGNVLIMGTKTGVLARGRLNADVELVCDRCLRSFSHHLEFPLKAEFEDEPTDDQFPIDRNGSIDLLEAIRQDIEIHLPMQRLCQDDCNGLRLNQTKDNHGSS